MSDQDILDLTVKSVSESEEDGEIEKDEPEKYKITNSPIEDEESDSSRNDEIGDDSLDIKPPQATFATHKDRGEKRESRKKDRHSRKHESRRKERRRSRERGMRMEERGMRSESRRSRDHESRRHRHREESRREKEVKENKDVKETREIVREIKDVRDRLSQRTREKVVVEREKERDEREQNRERLQREWRKERLMYVEQPRRAREVRRVEPEKGFLRKEDVHFIDEKEYEIDKNKKRERSRSPIKKPIEEKFQTDIEMKLDKSKMVVELSPVIEALRDDIDLDISDPEAEESEGEQKDSAEEVEDEPIESSSSSSSDSEESTHSSDSEQDEKMSDGEVADAKSEEEEPGPERSEEEKDILPMSPPKPKEEEKDQLPPYLPAIQGCRSVEEFHCLNRIEEGTYGVVYRARDKRLNEIVALKRLKMEKEKEGFPITSLREINTLLKAQHPNIVTVREIVVGSNMDKIYIVMDYVEHDLKSLMETMKQPFLVGEVKTLMVQLLRAVAHLHDNWILHRDLKTSNLLLSHKGILKVGDFGLAREYGSPLKPYTPVVVTLWYRAPELLLGAKEYSTPIDMWSVGCIFGELLSMKPLFPGKSEIDQLNRIFKDLGTPSEKIWPGYSELPMVRKVTFTEYPYNNLQSRFGHNFTKLGFDLMNRFLTYNPARRVTAEEALSHEYFKETPQLVPPSMFPTWPAKSEQVHRKAQSPKPPSGGKQYARQLQEDDEGLIANASGFHMNLTHQGTSAKGAGFSLKF
ncbi:cyclin-dependent kinase 11B-like isoform X1 [Centruroides vittatus]|uniref:cyclin-dependent kinase 11B-like isoform X1 n=1 Tax=Centruroides vittatus TaxID=120091 RepID=UPI0035100E1F